MNKCDFCPDSHLENGKLVCPFLVCHLTSSDLKEIIKEIAKVVKK